MHSVHIYYIIYIYMYVYLCVRACVRLCSFITYLLHYLHIIIHTLSSFILIVIVIPISCPQCRLQRMSCMNLFASPPSQHGRPDPARTLIWQVPTSGMMVHRHFGHQLSSHQGHLNHSFSKPIVEPR